MPYYNKMMMMMMMNFVLLRMVEAKIVEQSEPVAPKN